MTNLQRRLASEILKVGLDRVWFDPTKLEEIKKAITRKDIKNLIKKGYIKALPPKIKKPKAKRKRKGPGSRKGGKYARLSKKERWIRVVRPLRRFLKELKEKNQITNETYKKMRKLVKGGMFRSRAHLKLYLKQRGLLKE